MESELLQEIKRINGALDKQLRVLAGDHYVEGGGFRYYAKYGGMGGNTGEILILVSVGDEFPADIVVKKRKRNLALAEKATKLFGSLPSIVPGLHEEAAADLMARASVYMKSPNAEVVQLLLDVPMMQRSKQYYLKKIEEFLQNCKEPAGMCIYSSNVSCVIKITTTALITYLGHSEEGSGNWCFKDGTISFQEIFQLYKIYCSNKRITIVSDCSHSGHWVRECAKTLDSLHIPPCGHRARENRALVKVVASCQPHEEAAEPCYSIEGVRVRDDGAIVHSDTQLTQQTSRH